MTGQSRPHDQNPLSSLPSDQFHRSGTNVFRLIALREVSPRTKHVPKRQWGEASKVGGTTEEARDARRGLLSWVEAETLCHLSAKYRPLVPPPRSTIAAAFSPDGRTLASTHGDHTVKIIDCQTGSCLKVLSGHRRTPWVVRFHPLHPEILASGSLDYEITLLHPSLSTQKGISSLLHQATSCIYGTTTRGGRLHHQPLHWGQGVHFEQCIFTLMPLHFF